MTEIQAVIDQIRMFADQHVDVNWMQQAVPAATLCLIAGVVLCVLGAKLSRYGAAFAFAALGGFGGAYFANRTGFAFPICAAAGALAIGVVGYLTFRLWVGVAAAVVFSSVALGAFGYHRVLPHVAEFDQPVFQTSLANNSTMTLPSPDEQMTTLDRKPEQWFQEFWAFVTESDRKIERNAWALGIGAMVIGLCLGVLAIRPALILSSSLVGTAMVVSAIAALWSQLRPGISYQTIESQPGLFGVLVGGFLVSSLIVQTLITRPAPSGGGSGSKSR